jgi:hypothetical protein
MDEKLKAHCENVLYHLSRGEVIDGSPLNLSKAASEARDEAYKQNQELYGQQEPTRELLRVKKFIG